MRRARGFAWELAIFMGGLALVSEAHAHPLAPSLFELRELGGGVVSVRFRTPRLQPAGAAVVPELPSSCSAKTAPELVSDTTGVTFHWLAECPETGLRGTRVRVNGLLESGTDALLRLELGDGETVRTVLRPGAESFVIPLRASRLDVATAYLRMGCEHLLGGIDHLLFVLGLVLLLPDRRRLLTGITGFTLGHSVTLSLAALGVVHVPTNLVEVGIAASLFWLATQLARGAPGGEPIAHPWRMGALFGLLHGLGFAGALAQAGLPAGEIPLALFAFNLGIEVGQLAAIAGWLALQAVFAPWRAPNWLSRVPAYAIGTLAAALIFERAAALL